MPVIRLKSVVLPAPFGPITLTISSLVDVQVELGAATLQAAEGSETPSSSSSSWRPSDDLHAALAEQALRPRVHQHDQDHADHDLRA